MNPSPAPSALALWPASASAAAVSVDHLILLFTIVTLMLTVPIFVAFSWFSYKYRAGKDADRRHTEERSTLIEMSWMIIPFICTLIFFVWAARLFIEQQNPPADAIRIAAIGRQWMWKFQHPGGQAEINDLHVPVGQTVRIDVISQDVIHALYVPALRIQIDALPGRYTTLWFKANRVGEFHLLCSEYCGTDHSVMGGRFVIMEPAAYQDWLAHSGAEQSLAEAGHQVFQASGCAGCHAGSDLKAASNGRAPSLAGIFGSRVKLTDGSTATVDEDFIRDMIVQPEQHPVAGYAPIMPSYRGQIPEDQLGELVNYVKSLHAQGAPG